MRTSVPWVGLLALCGIASVVWVRISGRQRQATELGGPQYAHDEFSTELLFLGVTIAFVVGLYLVLAIQLELRMRRLEARDDVDLVFSFINTKQAGLDLAWLLRGRGAEPKEPLLRWTAAVTASVEGLTFWRGVIHPVPVVAITWADVLEIDRANRNRLSLVFRRGTGHVSVRLRVENAGAWSPFPPRRDYVERTAAALRALRGQANSPISG